MKILIIGAGKMGEAILRAWTKRQFNFKIKITVIEIDPRKNIYIKSRYPNISISIEIPSSWKGDLVLLAIKPQTFINMSTSFSSIKIDTKIVLSIMAGITLNKLKSVSCLDAHYVRAMPNLASSLGKGVTGVYSKKIGNQNNKNKIHTLLGALGSVFWLKNEELFDSLTAISGSGPAYFFLFFLTIKNIAKSFGFTNKVANDLVLNTAEGAVEIFKENSNLEKLILDVASPGGTTEAALKVLMKNKPNLISVLNKAILAANKRSKKLGKNAKRV